MQKLTTKLQKYICKLKISKTFLTTIFLRLKALIKKFHASRVRKYLFGRRGRN